MPELPGAALRHDLVADRWVAVAPHRHATPLDVVHATRVTGDRSTCPFCPGHEDQTSPGVSARTERDGAWIVRAFRNLFPTVSPDAPRPPAVAGGRARRARGDHEVLVETPDHDRDLADVTDDHARAVVDLYRERLRALAALPGARAALLFKNRGPRAGASLLHAHAQVVALPLVPPAVRRRDAVARRVHRETGHGSVGLARDRELAAGLRLVESTARFVVFCPYASHRRFETWIVPHDPLPTLAELPDGDLGPLGALLTRTLRRVLAATQGADYNLVLRTPALAHMNTPWAQWHLEIHPRIAREAGFELSSGMYCTSGLPEESAAALRAAL